MQVKDEGVVHTIQNHLDKIAYFHTDGVPGRNDINGTQELDYAAVIRAVMDSGYEGFVGIEFLPKGEPVTA